MGSYNPIYWILTKFAPGFNLFRVPARWLALWALGAALLAGFGYESLKSRVYKSYTPRIVLTCVLILILVALNYLSTNYTPPGETGPLPQPTIFDLYCWTSVLAMSALILRQKSTALRTTLLSILIIIEIGLASLNLPINNLTLCLR
jgi:predicted membrane protein